MPPAEPLPIQPPAPRQALPAQARRHRSDTPVEYPESDGRPMSESTLHRRAEVDLIGPLEGHDWAQPGTFLGGDLMMFFEEGNPHKSVSPDVFVAFGELPEPPRPIWLVWEEGKLADFVLEVKSKTTRSDDEERKKKTYAQLGVTEHWQFDPIGDYLDPVLDSQRLRSEGHYERIALEAGPENSLVGRSEVLGLELRLEGERLRLFDPKAGGCLLTRQELADGKREQDARLRDREASSREKDLVIQESARAHAAAQRRIAELEQRLLVPGS